MQYQDFPVADIKAINRTRKEMGELLNLTCSIERVGLLHPIVLNSNHELVAGGRRLAAVKKLGWVNVPTVIVESLDDATIALAAERDENTCRKPWTASELAESGRRLEELERPAAEERKGKRTDLNEPAGKFPAGSDGRVRDKVGEALGVSGKTYEKAKAIADTAIDALKAMVDSESVSIDAASEVAKMSKTEQAKIVAGGPEAVKKAAKKAKAGRQPKPEAKPDAEAEQAEDPADLVKQMETTCRELDQIKRRIEAWKELPLSYCIHFPTIVGGIERLRSDLWGGRPAYPCPYCEAKGAKPDCKACKGTQSVVKHIKESGASAMNRYGGVA